MRRVVALVAILAGRGDALYRFPARTYGGRASVRMSLERVVVTGLGPVSGVGMDQTAFFDGLVQGKSSLGPITRFDTEPAIFTCKIGSQVSDDFVAGDYFTTPKSAKSNDRFTHFAVAASRLALDDAQLDISSMDPTRAGVVIGSAFGGMESYELNTLKAWNGKKVSPFTIPALLGNTAAGVVGIEFGCKGPNFGAVSACASATHSIGSALDFIQKGQADVMIAGGTEAALTPTSFAGFCSMKAMSTKYNDDPTKGSRPFDAGRCGFVMGEGAGVVVLESLSSALKRGAKIYCEVVGYGASCDAHHITTPAPEGEGLGRCMTMALDGSGVDLTEVDYINAHGTSTAYNDKFETMAIKGVFGDHAYDLHVSSIKGSTGHTLGAAGGLEAIACAKAIETGWIPPTINYETPDPDCDLNVTPNTAVQKEVRAALSTNLGFGGHNAAVLFKKFDP